MATSTPTVDPKASPQQPLVAGERLTTEEFLERYEQMPGVRARLLGGVAHFKEGGMASPVGDEHGSRSNQVGGWLWCYANRTPGVRANHDTTVDLGLNRVCQPDNLLRILEECGGQSRRVGKYLAGPLELVVEVADATRSVDLGPQKLDYERAGVPEYIVVALDPDEIYWYILEDGRYARIDADADGIYRSHAFPGLWLDSRAFWKGDGPALLATLDRGVTSPEHAEFVTQLERVKSTRG